MLDLLLGEPRCFEMKKMRVTVHGGKGTATHNEHGWMPDDEQKKIRLAWDAHGNMAWNDYIGEKPDGTLKDHELAVYEELFGATLAAQNERYKKKGNYAKMRSMADWMQASQHAPKELILQIGDKDNHSGKGGKEIFKLSQITMMLKEWLEKQAPKNLCVLDATIHYGESTPHVHLRYVIFGHDKDGLPTPGVKAGLREAGIGLPDPARPEGSDNYRLATLHAGTRTYWQNLAKALGYEIETEIDEKRKALRLGHMGVDAYKSYAQASADVEHKRKMNKKAYDSVVKRAEAVEAAVDAVRLREQAVEQERVKLAETARRVSDELLEREKAIEEREQAETERERLNSDAIKRGKAALAGDRFSSSVQAESTSRRRGSLMFDEYE